MSSPTPQVTSMALPSSEGSVGHRDTIRNDGSGFRVIHRFDPSANLVHESEGGSPRRHTPAGWRHPLRHDHFCTVGSVGARCSKSERMALVSRSFTRSRVPMANNRSGHW